MQIKYLPDDRPKLLRWLTHGVELAIDRFGPDKASCQKAIWCLIGEALETMDRVPDQEKRWLSSGTRSGGWSQVGLTAHDLIELERSRILSAMSPFEVGNKIAPQRDTVERAVGVLLWTRWLSDGDDHRLLRAAVLLAGGREDAAIKAYASRIKGSNRVTYEIRTQTVGRILRGLREDAGITPSPDKVRFQELYPC